ncbi:MAG TPA: response regulator [Anaeromyxobacteraceae bacterium]|nr:response regulator [Anaeromyxobacteraceae bacterium]
MPKNLLLADDSITIQKVVGITFTGEDFRITAVDNGEEALARARELRPDVILADVVMPRKNGYELCEAVKADPALRHIPVLLLAGTFEAFDEGRARAVRADGHIGKPFESQALITKVKQLLDGAAQPAAAAPAPGPAIAAPPKPAARPPAPPLPAPTPPRGTPLRAPPWMPAGAPPAVARPAGAPPPVRPQGAPPAVARPPAGSPPPARPSAPMPVAARLTSPIVVPAQASPRLPSGPPPAARAAPPAAPVARDIDLDWTDVDLAEEAPPAPAAALAPPPGHAKVEAIPGAPVVPLEQVDFREASHFEPIELPEASAEELELASASEFVPPPSATGHQPKGPAAQSPMSFEPLAAVLAPASGVTAPPSAAAPSAAATADEVLLREALSRASRELIERIAWEVVPQLAETIIREQLDRLAKERQR